MMLIPKPTRRLQRTVVLASLALATTLAGLHPARAELVNQWTGDNYSSGAWVDSIGAVAASASGTPIAVPGAFNTHAGVAMNGGYFIIPAGTAPAGLSNFTVVIVFKNTGFGPFSGNYYNSIPLAAFDIGGGGQIDWGLSYGGTTGQNVVCGIGVQNASGGANGDIQQQTPKLAFNTVHAIAFQINATATNIMTYADGLLVASNSTVNLTPRSSANTVFVGGGTFVTARFPGQIAALQIYNDATTNCVALTQSLLNTYATPAPITLPYSAGADVGQNAPVTVGIPANASQSGSFSVTLTSDNPSVVASTTVSFAQGESSKTANLPILAVGTATLTASGSGVGSATMLVAGLDESGLVNAWLADNYTNNSPYWVDHLGGVVATGTGNEVAIPAAFGPTHQGVARNATGTTTGTDGFLIPAGTAPCNLSTYTIAVVFKPTSTGPNSGNYYGSQIIYGFDIGGTGQRDVGMSWGGGSPAPGQRIVVGIGRSGGDSQIQSAGGIPLALNTTHAAVLQVNAAAGTETLFIDGLQVGQNSGLTMNAVNSQNIPLLNQSSANIANAFPGLLAEVRVYNNAAVNGAALSSLLQTKYAGLPLLSLSSPQPFVDIGSNLTVSITIPASASLGGAFNVALTSDNPGVVGSTNVTFAKGVTNTTVSLPVLSVGAAMLTASGSGVSTASLLVGGLAPRTLVEAFRASSLPAQSGLSNGDAINNWNGDTNPATFFTYTGSGNAPTFHAGATPNGKPAAAFNLGSLVLNTNNCVSPLAGFTNFSIAMVFKASAPGLGAPGSQWYNGVGILDADMAGAFNEWGTAIDASGNFIFGVGNSDASIYQPNYSLVNPLFHALVMTWDGLNQQMRLFVDDQPATSLSGSSVPTGPRINSSITLGGTAAPPAARTDPAALFIQGEFAEVQFYNGALTGAEATNLINSLQNTYGLVWPDQALCTITASPSTEDIGSNITCTVSIPQGLNSTRAVTVTVTSSSAGVVAIGGGATTNLTFAAGAAPVQSFTARTVGAGSATLTATSTGLVAGNVLVTVLPPPALIEAFRASSLASQVPGIADGDPVSSWASDTNSVVAMQNNPNPPTFRAHATATGAPAVAFDAANQNSLLLTGPNSPVGGLQSFSVALVFKATGPESSTSANWYSMSGILDAEEAGAQNDWGIAMDSGGNLNFGLGNPDYTLLNPNDNLVNSNLVHIAVLAYDALHQQLSITVDDRPTTVSPAGTTLSTNPRNPTSSHTSGGDIHFGQGATDGLYWNGELIEADFYKGAIKTPAATIQNLKAAYGVVFSSQVLLSLTPLKAFPPQGSDVTLKLTIPVTANQSQPVTVSITNSDPAVVSLAGSSGGVLQVTFPAGATNVQDVVVHALAVGTATLAYGAPNYLSGTPVSLQVLEPAGDGLVGQWNFNDLAHPYVDSSGFRPSGTHDGVVIGNVSLTNDVPPGLTGYSLNLMATGALQILNTRLGETAYRNTFDDLLVNGMTIAAWVKLNTTWNATSWVPFVSKHGEDNLGYQLRRFSTGPFATFTLRGTPGADDPSGLTAYEDGNWHHIVGVWDGLTGTRSLYVDGFLDVNASLTGDFGPYTLTPTNNLVLGARDHSNDGTGSTIEGYLLGLLKDVRIYSYPLTSAQVRTVMAGRPVTPAVTLQVQRAGEKLTLTWSQGKLLEALSLNGPWSTNATAVSPYQTPITGTQKFYRVQVSP